MDNTTVQGPIRPGPMMVTIQTETSRALLFTLSLYQLITATAAVCVCAMATMRSALSRGLVTRSMDSTSQGAFTRFFSDKGRVLSEEEQAKENVYIQKWEREKLEKQKLQGEKAKAEKDKDTADKKPEGTQKG